MIHQGLSVYWLRLRVTSSVLTFLPPAHLVLGRFVQIDDMYGTWNANAYIDERDEIIHALAKWADKDPKR